MSQKIAWIAFMVASAITANAVGVNPSLMNKPPRENSQATSDSSLGCPSSTASVTARNTESNLTGELGLPKTTAGSLPGRFGMDFGKVSDQPVQEGVYGAEEDQTSAEQSGWTLTQSTSLPQGGQYGNASMSDELPLNARDRDVSSLDPKPSTGPEPASVATLLLGAFSLMACLRKKRRA